MTKKNINEILKSPPHAKTHPKTLIIASLTAVTLALISSKLTTMVNSLTLVVFITMGTAVVSELYRVLVEVFHAKTVNSVNMVLTKRGIKPLAVGEVEEDDYTPPLTRWAPVTAFAIVAILTVFGAYSVGLSNEKPDVFNKTQIIKPIHDISQKQINELKQDNFNQVNSKLSAAQSDTEADLNLTREQLLNKIKTLEEQLHRSDAENTSLRRNLVYLSDKVDRIEVELAARKNDSFNNSQNSRPTQSTTAPTPTANVEPTPSS